MTKTAHIETYEDRVGFITRVSPSDGGSRAYVSNNAQEARQVERQHIAELKEAGYRVFCGEYTPATVHELVYVACSEAARETRVQAASMAQDRLRSEPLGSAADLVRDLVSTAAGGSPAERLLMYRHLSQELPLDARLATLRIPTDGEEVRR